VGTGRAAPVYCLVLQGACTNVRTEVGARRCFVCVFFFAFLLFNPLRAEFRLHNIQKSFRTLSETHHISVTKINRLMWFREQIDFYYENHTKHTHALCEQNAEF
jgi:hypothetical protein